MRKFKYSKEDFSEDSLPNNRREQFFDIVKMEWRTLFYIGLSIFLTTIPLAALLLFKSSYSVVLTEQISSAGEANDRLYKFVLDMMFDGGIFLCIFLVALGIAGNLRVLRNLAWGEGVLFWRDFKDGIRKNYKPTILILLVAFLFLLINHTASFAIDLYAVSPMNVILIVILDFVEIAIFLPVGFVGLSLNSFYNVGAKKTVTASFIVMIKTYLLELPLVAFLILLHFALSIPGIYIGAIIFTISSLLLSPLLSLMTFLSHVSCYDKLINQSYPEYLFRGLYKIKD